MEFTWSDAKRTANLGKHALDFRDASEVFAGATFTFEDDRFDYDETRYVTLGLLQGVPVSIVHTETTEQMRILSFRKATKHEQAIYFQSV